MKIHATTDSDRQLAQFPDFISILETMCQRRFDGTAYRALTRAVFHEGMPCHFEAGTVDQHEGEVELSVSRTFAAMDRRRAYVVLHGNVLLFYVRGEHHLLVAGVTLADTDDSWFSHKWGLLWDSRDTSARFLSIEEDDPPPSEHRDRICFHAFAPLQLFLADPEEIA